jgi:hypothetical protein
MDKGEPLKRLEGLLVEGTDNRGDIRKPRRVADTELRKA